MGRFFLEVGLKRKFVGGILRRNGGGLDSHSLGEGCCRSLLAFILKGPDSGFLH